MNKLIFYKIYILKALFLPRKKIKCVIFKWDLAKHPGNRDLLGKTNQLSKIGVTGYPEEIILNTIHCIFLSGIIYFRFILNS